MPLVTLKRTRRGLAALAVVLSGCGGDASPGAQSPEATAAPPAGSQATPQPSAASSGSAAASASASPPKGSGRPVVLKSDEREISDTFGSTPGAKLVLGSGRGAVVLHIPEGALREPMVITFKVDTKGKSAGGLQGAIYRIEPVIPPSPTPESAESVGPPFEVDIPARKTTNLAVGVEDEHGKVTWTIVAPTRMDEARGTAHFELPTLPAGWLHTTSRAATNKP